MQDAHPSSATNLLYDLELFLTLFTAVLLITLAIPIRKLTLSPDTLFHQSYHHSQYILHGEITSSEMAYSCTVSPHQAQPGGDGWLLERKVCILGSSRSSF